MTMTTAPHPWILTGPWYRWPMPGVPEAGRKSKPEIQKYAGFDFASELLKEPQRSLVWKDEDYYHRTISNPNKPAPVSGPAAPGTWLREKTQIRKLYKPNHARSYLVVVELHCDVPGLPSVARSEVAEAGFVVRRLKGRVEDGLEAKATAAFQQVELARMQVAALERNLKGRIKSASGLVLQRQLERPVTKKLNELFDDWSQGKLALDELAAAGAFGLDTEAWIPDPIDPLRGAWKPITDATPDEDLAGELFIPLYPLNPDPRDRKHSAAGRTLYFGVIPVGGREADAGGAPRFDDQHLFEIRCVVRRQPHKPGCVGKLVWSEPTVGYRLAPDLDPEGTANLPISITVPSFKDLQALADSAVPGGLRVVQPPDSVMPLKGDFPDLQAGPKTGLGQICFFAIILLFIIALFLVFAFLPIIVFLFQLFFLLQLKFCIPPSINIELSVAVELKASLDIELEVGASIDLSAQAFVDAGITTLAELETWADDLLTAIYGPGRLLDGLIGGSLDTKLQRIMALRTDFRGSIDPVLLAELGLDGGDPPPPLGSPMAPPLPTGGALQYYEVIEVPA
ncbi:hypothetical protein ACNOYE_19345 [Nannocystaceae bacterium ST9]